jgi:hypothetical protein
MKEREEEMEETRKTAINNVKQKYIQKLSEKEKAGG